MDIRSIYALIMSGYPVYIEGGSGLGKTEFLHFLKSQLADPDLAVMWNVAGLDDKELSGLTYANPNLVDDSGVLIEVPFTNFALTRASIKLRELMQSLEQKQLEGKNSAAVGENLKGIPEVNGKRIQVLIAGDEIKNAPVPIKRSLQAAITSGGKWAGLDIGSPLVVFGGNPSSVSSLSEPLGPSLNTRLIRVDWEYNHSQFIRYIYLVAMREHIETMRKANATHERMQYTPLTDDEFVAFLSKLADRLNRNSPSAALWLNSAIEFAKDALKNEKTLTWDVGYLPDPAKVTEYHKFFSTLLLPYFYEGRYDSDLANVDFIAAVDQDEPIPTNRTLTMGIGAAAVLAALYDDPTHPDVKKALIGAVGPHIGSRLGTIISNHAIPSPEEIKNYLRGVSGLDNEKMNRIRENPDCLYGFINLLLEEAKTLFAETLDDSRIKVANPLANSDLNSSRAYLNENYVLFALHPQRLLFGASKEALDMLDRFLLAFENLGDRAFSLKTLIFKAIPIDYTDQIRRSLEFIARFSKDINTMAEEGKLADALGPMLFFDVIAENMKQRKLDRAESIHMGGGAITPLSDMMGNLAFFSHFGVGRFNFIPIAAKYFKMLSGAFSIGNAGESAIQAAQHIAKLFESGHKISVSDELVLPMLPSMEKTWGLLTALGKGRDTDFNDIANTVSEYLLDGYGYAMFLLFDIHSPLVKNHEMRLNFMRADQKTRANMIRAIAADYKPNLVNYRVEEILESLILKNRGNTAMTHDEMKAEAKRIQTEMRTNMLNAANVLRERLPINMHRCLPPDRATDGITHGILHFSPELKASIVESPWYHVRTKKSKAEVRVSGESSATHNEMTELEQRLAIAGLLALGAGVNVMLVGDFGIGKTAWANSLAELAMSQLDDEQRMLLEKHKLSPLVFVPGPSLDPPELGGISYPYFNPKTKTLQIHPAAPFFFKDLERVGNLVPDVTKIVLLDEITGMRPQTLRALSAAMPNHLGGLSIRGPVVWVATGNPSESSTLFLDSKRVIPSTLAEPLPEVIRRRFVVLPLAPSVIDSRDMQLSRTFAHFLEKNRDAAFVPGRGFQYNTRWASPSLPSQQAIASATLYWHSIIADFTAQAPTSLTQASGLHASDLLPFDTPATRDKLARALGVLSAAGHPYNSDDNVLLVTRAALGLQAGNEFYKFWKEVKDKKHALLVDHVRDLIAEARRLHRAGAIQ